VHDYLLVETDLERLEMVLTGWIGAARTALHEQDVDALRATVLVLERSRRAATEPERATLFDIYRNRAPEPEVLRRLVARAKEPDGHAVVVHLLDPLEEVGLAALLDLLAGEHDLHERSVIVALASDLAQERFDVIANRVDDPRPPVVRDAVTVACRSAGAQAMPVLERAARHPSAEVRQEVVRGLIAVAGGSAAGLLRDLASDPDEQVRRQAVAGLGGLVVPTAVDALGELAVESPDPATRRDALEGLSRHPSPEARIRLRTLAASKRRSGLPRTLRRYARSLLRS
jgi:HEAT repeat protein